MANSKITIQTTAAAPVSKVWEYWNAPEHITQWNVASDDWCCPRAEIDLRPGGRYTVRMEAKDGSFGFDFEAVYDDVVEHEKIAYTMTDGREALVTFDAQDGATHITITFDAESENPVEMQRDGWQNILDNFRKYVEAN